MATLQSFQAEIEDIRNRELAKTRTQSQPEALRRGHTDHKPAPKVKKKAVGGDTPATSPVTPKCTNDSDQSTQDLSDIERSIEVRHTCTTPIRHFFADIPRIECALIPNGGRYSGAGFNSDTPNPTRRGVSPSIGRSSPEGTIILR